MNTYGYNFNENKAEFIKKKVYDEARIFGYNVYPKEENVFKALELCPIDKVKVVIIGQDPYHEKNQANGLAFSVNNGNKLPPSLRNIFTELEDDTGIIRNSSNCDLSDWAKQGVLLLNSTLTVEEGKANSHRGVGWYEITREIISSVNDKSTPVIFLLWGNYAKSYKELITNPNHIILESAHPSPLSAYRGFFDSKPFSKINYILERLGKSKIDW